MPARRQFVMIHVFFGLAGLLFVGVLLIRVLRGVPSLEREGPTARLPPSSIVEALGNPATRLAGLHRVGQDRIETALPLVRVLTKDHDAQVRKAACWALGRIGNAEAVYALRVRLTDAEPLVRREAALALGRLGESGDDAAIYSLLKALEDEDIGVRVAAVQGMANIKNPAATEALTRALDRDTPQPVRVAAITALAGRRDEKSSAAISQAVRDRDDGIREAAVRALGERCDPACYSALVAALDDANPGIRALARESVGRIGEPILAAVSEALPTARHVEARLAAVSLLDKSQGDAAVRGLLRLLENVNERRDGGRAEALREAVTAALARRGTTALDAVVRVAVEGEAGPLVEQVASDLCRRIGKPAVAPIVRSILRWRLYPDPAELSLWVRILGEIGDPAANEVLDFALGQDIEGIEATVAEARAAIERRSGASLPPPRPVRRLAPPAGVDVARIPSSRKAADSPSTRPCERIPDEGVLALTLHRALGRSWEDPTKGGRDLQVHMERRGGRWLDPVWGHGYGYNVRYHGGRVVDYTPGADAVRLKLEMFILEDEWIPGGYAEYDLDLNRTGSKWSGTYSGHYNYRKVNGTALGDSREGAILTGSADTIASGEHPRLLFRVGDLPALRARAQTDLGRAIVRALRARIAPGKVEDWTGFVDSVQTWESGMDRVVGMGFLATLFEDREMGKRAAMAFMPRVRIKPYMGEHGEVGIPRIHAYGYGFDMAYPHLSEAERVEARQDMITFWGYTSAEHGMLANMTGGSPPAGYAITGPGVLAMLREPGPLYLRPPAVSSPVTVVPPDPDPAPIRGITPQRYEDGCMVTNWLVNGPFPTNVAGGILAALGGADKARPEEGTQVKYGGNAFAFLRLPPGVIRQTPGFGGKGACIMIPTATETSWNYAFALLHVPREQGAQFDCRFPTGFGSARVWFNGQEVGSRCLLILPPGVHRIMIELVGSAFSPYFSNADAYYLMAQNKKDEWKQRRFQEARARHDRNGEYAGVPWMVENTVNALRDRQRLETEHALIGGRFRGGGFLWNVANCYGRVTGEPLARDHAWVYVLRPDFLDSVGDEDLCNALQLAPESAKPVVLAAFKRRVAPNLGRLSCRALVTALASVPMDVDGAPAAAPQAIAEPERGQYTFGSGRDADAFRLLAFARSAWPSQPVQFLPPAGALSLYGAGMDWIKDAPRYQNVPQIGPGWGEGLGRVTHYAAGPDGSGTLSMDLSAAYGDRVRASRHIAVDYSGRCGSPVLLALLDRIQGTGAKTWRLYLGGEATNGSDNAFQALQPGAARAAPGSGWNLKGVLCAPDDAPLHIARACSRKQFDASAFTSESERPDAVFFAVLTLQAGPAPAIAFAGTGPDATATIGARRVSFDGSRLLLQP